MIQKLISLIEVESYDLPEELKPDEQKLLLAAEDAMQKAYAPYSHFSVGAALLLETGQLITGSNQENAAYPSGMCAERVAFFFAGSQFPGETIQSVAITASSSDFEIDNPVPPCGACRQVMLEYELNQGRQIIVIMKGASGIIHRITGIKTLLPYHFKAPGLKK